MEKSTAQRILDVAQDMVRNRGYSAFSYADISKQVGIRKASIHYHFPSKDELVKELVVQYRQTMGKACDRIAKSRASLDQQLIQFANLYRDGLSNGQICLCAMLAADFAVLPESVHAEIKIFFRDTEAWLGELLQQGCDDGIWTCQPSVTQEAKGLIAMLQGAQLLARSADNSTATFEQVVYPLLTAKFSKS
ncbi:TetR/AcrR family transcriptional regulator [Leptothoe kymatousa]|uniref:TetR/AcrR family transcriptional regulator n=1 Tax=Leptothoe kymatousa TAU-MAC 1615 TaxID=2364775 RepID=A0ABS5Y723_9CYAN|nr:TetR/AcrR family transcriptional regulator [Leptothoe kymatousa]MBT9312760.1 TetR/AcrR family transcriptional regulator [Leptothoe kymatousa TAU-MAC 1615]